MMKVPRRTLGRLISFLHADIPDRLRQRSVGDVCMEE